MISVSLGDLIGFFEAILDNKDRISNKLDKKDIDQLRKYLSTLHFGRSGSLKTLEYKGLDDYIAIIQRDTRIAVAQSLEGIMELANRIDLPIQTKDALVHITQDKERVRAELAKSLLARDQNAKDKLVREIRNLNEKIIEIENYLFEISNR